MTSLNAHCGPVDLLVFARSSLSSDFLRRNGEEAVDGGGGGEEDDRKVDQTSEALPPSQEQRLMLRYRLSSTHQLPGKLLTAQPEHDTATDPTHSPEHRPEDGSIYALSEDPDVWVRERAVDWEETKEARRGRLASTAVFSAGRGHRRVDQPASDTTTSTLLVWQLPLTISQ